MESSNHYYIKKALSTDALLQELSERKNVRVLQSGLYEENEVVIKTKYTEERTPSEVFQGTVILIPR